MLSLYFLTHPHFYINFSKFRIILFSLYIAYKPAAVCEGVTASAAMSRLGTRYRDSHTGIEPHLILYIEYMTIVL